MSSQLNAITNIRQPDASASEQARAKTLPSEQATAETPLQEKCFKVYKDRFFFCQMRRVKITNVDGVTEMTGTVDSFYYKQMAYELVKHLFEGIKENNLLVEYPVGN